MRSDTSNSVWLPPSVHSLRESSLMIGLRGSPMVYTGWPKPMTISLRSMRARMSASASSAVRVAADDVHRHFVGAAVLGAAQRADRAGDARMHVRAGAGDHARGERRGVELVLGVQHQRLVERVGVQRARRLAVQQVQEVRGDESSSVSQSMRRPLRVKCHQYSSIEPKLAISRSAMSRASGGRMAFALRQHRAQHRAAGAHHVHRVRVGRHQLQRFGDDRRQAAQALELGLVGIQLRHGRQRAVHQQVRDFLEGRLRGQVVDVVAAVMQVVAAAADRAQRGVAGGGAGQRDGFLGLRSAGAGVLSLMRRSSLLVLARTARRACLRRRGSRGSRTARRASAACR